MVRGLSDGFKSSLARLSFQKLWLHSTDTVFRRCSSRLTNSTSNNFVPGHRKRQRLWFLCVLGLTDFPWVSMILKVVTATEHCFCVFQVWQASLGSVMATEHCFYVFQVWQVSLGSVMAIEWAFFLCVSGLTSFTRVCDSHWVSVVFVCFRSNKFQ